MINFTRTESAEQIAGWLKILCEPNSTFEMRILYSDRPPCVRHYPATNLLTMARDAIRLGEGAKGVYWLLNPLPADWSGAPAKDADIVRRRWLLVDCDPKRKGTVSSTDAEKEAARAKVIDVDAFLHEQGWPDPIIGDSGNGWHLLYRIDLPGDDDGLLRRVLHALAQRFDDEAVNIDTKVGNASRICKLYGTIAAKGEPTIERPHRLSKIVKVPEQFRDVPIALLEKLANESNSPEEANCQIVPHLPDHSSYPAAVEQASKYLAAMDASIEGSRGSDRLIKAASVLVNDFALTDDETLGLLKADFNPRCTPPWSDAEIHHKINDAHKNPPNRSAKGPRSAAKGSSLESHTNCHPQNSTDEAIVVRLSDVQERAVEWLWPDRIPLGKLTLLAGDPGLGKSFVTVDMAARVSTGMGWPDCNNQGQPIGSVIMFNCEDDLADTVVPRLRRAGGDTSKVIALQGIAIIDTKTGQRRERGFSLDVDLPKLIDVLKQNPDVRLVVIDPVSAYCGATDSHKNADIRAMLAPLAEMASKYHVAVVMVTHLAKGGGGKSVYRAMGSLAFTAAARAVWHVAKDLDDDQRRLILLAKINIAEEASGLAYRLQDGAVCWDVAPVLMTADEYLEKEARPDRKQRGRGKQGAAVQEAVEWLKQTLCECSMLATAVMQLADDADISAATLKRAKKSARVKSCHAGFGKGSASWWTLPSDSIETAPVDVDAIEPIHTGAQR